MATELNQSYDPKSVEAKWYQAWEDNGCFDGEVDEENDSFAIMIPPPNVTGILTMGHVLNNTIQDILMRRARQQGKNALWQPGTDHASIATQVKVEQHLRDKGVDKRDLGREKFVETCWEWSKEHGGIIFKQLRTLGTSCDWRREVFTMDDRYTQSVLHAFVALYKRGYIYRGRYMTKWCPVSKTALSDEEVIMTPQKGHFWTMRYELVDSPGEFLQISTTRPETIMGDTAVAVHPDDDRYKDLVGKKVWRPFPREEIPIIADEAVDREFGTGALKVTPAHDQVDYEIGLRHDLPIVDVLNEDGTLNHLAGEEFEGMDRFEARKKAALRLEELGLLIKTEEYENNVGFSERGKVPIEPRLTDQWWMKYPKIEEAKRAVEKGIVKFHPERWEKVYLHWLNNIRDWAISRQLWWGQRLPVWYKKGADRNDPANVHVSVEGPADPENWEQEEDVLDTWASSWLWPFATLGWPSDDEKVRKELEYFYPTDDLVTGPDIIFFWVARMIIAGLEFMGDEKKELTDDDIEERIPFKNVYFTGMIRDLQGRKMSKSLGNSPDPLDLIDTYGADGLRFGIMNIAPKGSDILFSNERVEIGRNFCNKLWNACRFRQMSSDGASGDNTGSQEAIIGQIDFAKCDAFDHWILARTIETTKRVERLFQDYELSQLTHTLLNFVWGDFCDWYVEASKSKLNDDSLKANCLAVQDFVLRQSLQLLHPIMPHITEELWAAMGFGQKDSFLMQTTLLSSEGIEASLAKAGASLDKAAVMHIDQVKELITKARAIKAEYNVASKRDVSLIITAADAQAQRVVEENLDTIKKLAGAESIAFLDSVENAPGSVSALGTVYLDLASAIDVEAEKERLSKELAKLGKAIAAGEGKLNNESFISKAPPQVVEGAKKQLAETVAKRDEIQRLLQSL